MSSKLRKSKNMPPYPRLGDVYRMLANAFDTKNNNRSLDRLAQEGDFDWQLIPEIHEKVFFEPLSAKGNTAYATFVVETVKALHDDYVRLIKSVALDALTRAEALPDLIRELFVPRATAFLLNLEKKRAGPGLPVLLDSERNPIQVVFSWLERSLALEDEELGSKLFPKSIGEDKNSKNDLRHWRKGKHLPALAKIYRLSQNLRENYPEKSYLIDVFIEWLITARALAYLEQKNSYSEGLRGALLRQIFLDQFPNDIGVILSSLNAKAGNRLRSVMEAGLLLHAELHTKSPKKTGDMKRTERDLKRFGQLVAQQDHGDITTYFLMWLTGRWHVLAGKHTAALDYYEAAVDDSLYRSGGTQREILKEALCLAARQGKLTLYKRLKHRAIVFGMVAPPPSKKVADQDEMINEAVNFDFVFPQCGCFVEA